MKTAVKEPEKVRIWDVFDRIAPRYDLLNRLLSGGIDQIWRSKAARYLPEESPFVLLDMATGTADLLITFLKKSPFITHAIGMDMSRKLLEIGQKKIDQSGFSKKTSLVHGDALKMPFPDAHVDVISISFGIRNFSDLDTAFREIKRVLKSKGRLIILEFSIPQNRWIKPIYLFYFRVILPVIGSLISGDKSAYKYLNQSVETFPFGDAFCEICRAHGFTVKAIPLTFGIATIYIAQKC